MIQAQRVLVYGVTGCGKSTFAARLSERTGLPWFPVDDLCWDPDWKSVPDDEQRDRIGQIVADDRWILDSAYSKWVDLVLPRVELVVGLDFPRWLSLSRLIRRTIRRSITGEPCCNGNRESWRLTFSRKSIVGWHFQSFDRKRTRMRGWEQTWERDGTPRIVRFSSPSEAEAWLSTLVPPSPDNHR